MYVRRVRFVLFLFIVGLAAVLARAVQLQVVEHAHLKRLAQEQYLNTVHVPARRGEIYDRNHTPLAISVDVPSVFAHPHLIGDARQAARVLAPLLHMSTDAVLQRLTNARYFAWIKRHVDPATAQQVQQAALPGVGITKEPRRFYPNRDIGAHVVGFSGLDARGLEGIEKQFDRQLLGAPQAVPAVRDARGQAVLAGGLEWTQKTRGRDIHLTLDLPLQHATQTALTRAVQQWRAKDAMAVVLDVSTATILALAVAPAYNLNQGSTESVAHRRNRALTDLFEPGSTLKPLVVAAALDGGAITPSTVFFGENGHMRFGRHTISDTTPHAWMGLTEVMAKSSNIGMAKIAQAMGRESLYGSLRSFGLGQRTGLELPGETPGVLRKPQGWSELELATIAFGQGVSVNLVQLAAAYRVLAADGMYLPPRIVQSTDAPDGSSESAAAVIPRRLVSEASARRVTAMLEASVTPKQGTGALAQVPGFRVAGKTGTAQKADLVTGGYSRDKYLALFAGYLPATAPRVVIVVGVDEPQGSHYGGTVAAPVFAELGAIAMQRLGVPAQLATMGGSAVAVAPALSVPVALATEDEPAVDVSPTAPGVLPSFVGLSARQAVQRFVGLEGSWELAMDGTGQVVRQSPAPGTSDPHRRLVKLTLAP